MGLLLFVWVIEVGHYAIRGGITGGIAAAIDRRDMGQDITGGTIVGSVAGLWVQRAYRNGYGKWFDQEKGFCPCSAP